MYKDSKILKNSFLLTGLIGYLLIVFYTGIHHHTFNILSYTENNVIDVPFSHADHDYEHCEKHYLVNSSISTLLPIFKNIVDYKSVVVKSVQLVKLYNCNLINNSRLRAPPENL